MANFVWTTIHVSDLEKSIHFYQDLLGLVLERRMPINEFVELVFLKAEDGFEVELVYEKGGSSPALTAPSNLSIGFVIHSLDEMTQKLEAAGYSVVRGPMAAIGLKFAFFQDPNGVTVQLIEKTA